MEKVSDYKELAVDTFQDYKTKFENGDITATDLTKAVQEKQLKLLTLQKRALNSSRKNSSSNT